VLLGAGGAALEVRPHAQAAVRARAVLRPHAGRLAVLGIAVGKTAHAQTHRTAGPSHATATATMDMSGWSRIASSPSETRCGSCGSTSPGRGLAIVSVAGNLPDLGATEARLLRNQYDAGAAVVPFYGRKAGHELTGLLRQHILIAVAILGDVKSGDTAALKRDNARWYTNANRIAAFRGQLEVPVHHLPQRGERPLVRSGGMQGTRRSPSSPASSRPACTTTTWSSTRSSAWRTC
jgi:hypothetical protein